MIPIIFFFLAFECQPSHAGLNALTLSQAIDYAVRSSPLMDSAKKSQVIRGWEYKNAIAKLLPSLDFSSSYGLQNNIPINGTYTLISPNTTAPWYSALSLGINENLYDNGVSVSA